MPYVEKGHKQEIVLFNLLAQRPTFNHTRIFFLPALQIAALLMLHNYSKCFEMFRTQVYKDTSTCFSDPSLVITVILKS